MAKAQLQLKKALNTYFNTSVACSTLRSNLTVNGRVNIFADNCPQNVKAPYLVYTLPSNQLDYCLNNINFDYINLQVSIYDDNSTMGRIIPIAAELEDCLDGNLLTLDSGYENFCMKLASSFELFPEKESCQIVQRYRVGISYSI